MGTPCVFVIPFNRSEVIDSLGFRVSRGALTSISPPHVTMPHLPISLSQNLYSSGYLTHTSEPVVTHQVADSHSLMCPRGIRYLATRGRTNCTRRSCVVPLKLWIQLLGWRTRPAAGEMKVVYGEGLDINFNDVALTLGCNLAFVAVGMAIADPGDRVILPVPW